MFSQIDYNLNRALPLTVMTTQSLIANQVSSLFQAVDIKQQLPPLIIGERSNPTGSKKFRELLLANDFDGLLQVGMDQEAIGAHVLDLCAAWAGRNEEEDLVKLVQMYSQVIKAPLMIDSTTPKAIEAALAHYPGRAIINSVNLEDGGKSLRKIFALAKRYGAAVVALTIDEQGMAMEATKKIAIAKRIHAIAIEEGLGAQDLLFDCLTFTVGSGDESLENAAIETLKAISAIAEEIPGAHTVLGLSNISFGLPPAARRVLNAVFLNEAVGAGLDAVIINPTNCIPLENIEPKARELALDLLYNNKSSADKPLIAYIKHFENNAGVTANSNDANQVLCYEEQLRRAVIGGSHAGLDDILHILMDSYTPLDIINNHLVATMKEIGRLFGSGEMLLPFVLKSAEVMKNAVDILQPYLQKADKGSTTKVLLATVQGDVHDIGKNLVNIILSNNGYEVIDIGIKVGAETIIAEAKKHGVDIICLSGLLVKSAIIMGESMAIYREAGLCQPILLGGAALTRKFVATQCAPQYPHPVVYCRDAFDGMAAIQAHEKGTLQSSSWQGQKKDSETKAVREMVQELKTLPTPPCYGVRNLRVTVDDIIDLIPKNALFRGQWGYKRGKMSAEEYQKFIEQEVEPKFAELVTKLRSEALLEPQVSFGWYPCTARDGAITVKSGEQDYLFSFPRQKNSPQLCLSDYFSKDREDVVGLFICTLGSKIGTTLKSMYEQDQYQDYFLLHGLCVCMAEALAEYTHKTMKAELGITNGARYSFGYSACPDLELQEPLCEILDARAIGIELSETYQMIPEHSVSAIVVHHRDARYFAI